MALSFGAAALATAVGLVLAPAAEAITPNCFLNISLGDNSPLIHYSPPHTWISLFVNSNPENWEAGMVGVGQSAHSVFGSGATATIEYPGTVAWVTGGIGNVSDTPLDFQIDGVLQPQPDIVNVSFISTSNKDIGLGSHTATIGLHATNTDPNAYMHFLGFQHVMGIAAETDDPEQVSCQETVFATAVGSTNFILDGTSWKPFQKFGGVGGQADFVYPTNVGDNTPSLSLYPPKGSNFFFLNGTVGNAYGLYSVDIQPAPPYPRNVNTFNASNAWAVPGETFYYAPLDPEVEYKIIVTGDSDPEKYLGLHSWQYCLYADQGSSTSASAGTLQTGAASPGNETQEKKTNIGAIVGGVVGGVVGAAAIAALVFFLLRRKRNKNRGTEPDPAMFTVDDTVDATTPYRAPSASGGNKLVAGGGQYGYGQDFAAVPYQEPNMSETGHGAVAAPLLSPFGTSENSGERQNSGPWGPDSNGSAQYHNGDPRMSLSAASGQNDYAAVGGKAALAHQAHQARQMSRVEHEEDAGGLPMPMNEEPEVERLPPTYNPNWLEDRSSQPEPSSSSASAGGRSLPQPPPGGVAHTPPPLPSKEGAGGVFQPPTDAKR